MLTPQQYDTVYNRIASKYEPMLLGYGGSIAYGTNLPTSDVDIRGFYMNPLNEFIGTKNDSEQLIFHDMDLTVYSLKKIIKLLAQCNPNVIEILGLRKEHYLYLTDEAQLLLDNRHLFLSKQAIYTFGNYAKSQLNRLINRSGKTEQRIAENETRSLQKSITHLRQEIGVEQIDVKLVDNTPVVTCHAELPIDKLMYITKELTNVHSDYKKNIRNTKAVDQGRLSKHMMHLLRLYMMSIDILEKQEIITYRTDEHDMLMAVRNGDFLQSDGLTPTHEFETLLREYTDHFEKAARNTTLPDKADMTAIDTMMVSIVRQHYFDRKDNN